VLFVNAEHVFYAANENPGLQSNADLSAWLANGGLVGALINDEGATPFEWK
jgi:hypothetical protein